MTDRNEFSNDPLDEEARLREELPPGFRRAIEELRRWTPIGDPERARSEGLARLGSTSSRADGGEVWLGDTAGTGDPAADPSHPRRSVAALAAAAVTTVVVGSALLMGGGRGTTDEATGEAPTWTLVETEVTCSARSQDEATPVAAADDLEAALPEGSGKPGAWGRVLSWETPAGMAFVRHGHVELLASDDPRTWHRSVNRMLHLVPTTWRCQVWSPASDAGSPRDFLEVMYGAPAQGVVCVSERRSETQFGVTPEQMERLAAIPGSKGWNVAVTGPSTATIVVRLDGGDRASAYEALLRSGLCRDGSIGVG